VKNVIFDIKDNKKVAKEIIYIKDNQECKLDLVEDDLVFITNGCCTDSSCYGDQNNAPDLSKLVDGKGESWDLWENIAKQDKSFGNPLKFCNNIEKTNWMSATIQTSDDYVISLIEKICKRDPRSGKVTTGGIVTIKDSEDNWFLSWTINRQPQFRSQNKNDILIWVYALTTNKNGNYIKKPMKECSGKEVCEEWLYHIGCDLSRIEEIATNRCNTTTCYMPYIDAFFEPRKNIDRPKVVPDGAINFAFIGQFAETPRDTIFTTEYSIRTGMEAVYTLLNIDRAVPEVWGSVYDIRELLRATYYALDKTKLLDSDAVNNVEKVALKVAYNKIKDTDIGKLLRDSKLF
ncbi:MAG TPA: oleate hydratase, partial [Clostridiales bacterium]|nr:oleate hydratase [Clostridiales bacterium]